MQVYEYCTDQGLYLRVFSVCELAKPKQSKSRNDSGIDNFWANVYLVSLSSIVEHRIQFVRLKILPLLHWSTLGLKVRSLQSCEMRAVEVLFKIGSTALLRAVKSDPFYPFIITAAATLITPRYWG